MARVRTRPPRFGPEHGHALLAPPSRPVLRDTVVDARLRRDGFAVLPFLDATVVGELHDLYGQLHGWSGQGFDPDLLNPDLGYRRAASDAIAARLDAAVGDLFVDHAPYLRNFLCKWPDDASALNLHRDWMYVDESGGDHTYVVWVPLVDVTWREGALEVLRHSHRVDPMVRGTHLSADWVMDEELVRPRLLTLPVAAGHAVVLDNALVHGSGVNTSGRPRPVVAVGMRRRGADLVYLRRSGPTTADRYAIDEEFFLTYTPVQLMAEPPDLEPSGVVSVTPGLEPDEVRRRLGSSALTRLDDGRRLVHQARRRAAARVGAGS